MGERFQIKVQKSSLGSRQSEGFWIGENRKRNRESGESFKNLGGESSRKKAQERRERKRVDLFFEFQTFRDITAQSQKLRKIFNRESRESSE